MTVENITDEALDEAIGTVVGGISDEEDDSQPAVDTETDEEQTPATEEQESKGEPSEPSEPEQSEDEPGEHEDVAPSDDFTPREKALYARMKKYQDRAKGSETKLTSVETEVAELRGRIDGIGQVQPQQQQEEEALDPEDLVTFGTLDNYFEQRQAKEQKAQQEAQYKFAGEIGTSGVAIYDDWQTLVLPIIPQVLDDPVMMQKLFNGQHPARAARILHDHAKKVTSSGVQPKQNNPVDTVLETITKEQTTPRRQQVKSGPRLDFDKLNAEQQERVHRAINLCQTDEQIDDLLTKLGLSG